MKQSNTYTADYQVHDISDLVTEGIEFRINGKSTVSV